MARKTAAERYAIRKDRVAQDLRIRTIAAANIGVRHARLRARYGPDWRGQLDRAWQRQMNEWYAIADRRNPYVRPGVGVEEGIHRG